MTDFYKYLLKDDANVRDALIALNNLSNDTLNIFVVDANGCVLGSLTDGDIRRKLIEGYGLEDNILKVINPNFIYINENELCVEKIKELKSISINLVPILNSKGIIIKILNLKQKKSILPIDAVLMAGGKGERLRPLTEKTPKPLLRIGEKSIIDYNVDSLIDYGLENIYVTTNYLAEQIEEHFDEVRQNVKIKCVREPTFLGTIGSVKFIKSFYNDTVLVMNSDLFTNINYEEFFLHYKRNDADMSVATVPYSVMVPYGIFDLEERVIKGIREKPTYNYYANSGIYLIKKELLDLIPDEMFFNATDFIEKLVAENYKVIRFPLVGYWIDIGKHEDFKKAQDFVKYL